MIAAYCRAGNSGESAVTYDFSDDWLSHKCLLIAKGVPPALPGWQ
jgi:hypothetical protein